MNVKLSIVFREWRKEKHYDRILSFLPEFDFGAVYDYDELALVVFEFSLALFHSDRHNAAVDMLRSLEDAQVTSLIQRNTDLLINFLRDGKRVVGCYDPNRLPKDDEIVIVYGDYPCSAQSLVCANPVLRNILYLRSINHDVWEVDACFDRLEAIVIVCRGEYDFVEGCRELARIRAPVHKTRAIRLDPSHNDLQRYAHTIRQLAGLRAGKVLVLYAGFMFPANWDSEYFAKLIDQEFCLCPINYQMNGRLEFESDVTAVAQTYQPNIRAFLLEASALKILNQWVAQQLRRIRAGQSVEYVAGYYWNWLIAAGLKVSRRQLCFFRGEFNTGS